LEHESRLLKFYKGSGPDHSRRRLDEILLWDDQALEQVHDYIQWLFPLDEPSAFNADAPLVTQSDRAAFRADPALAANLRRSLLRMLAFYGFRQTETGGTATIERAETWEVRSRTWLHPHNHNYLRLTRIMKSLVLLGQSILARALGRALLEEYRLAPDLIGPTTAGFWLRANGGNGSGDLGENG
jgi:Opioid growth factor receptor (OGFr) conserved region